MIRARLPLFLAIQALLGFWNLGLLAPWMDEVTTLDLTAHPPRFAIEVAAWDVHPPTFYLLVWCWRHLPLGLNPAIQIRILTVLLGLLATVAADRLLASRLPEVARTWFLALWCCSPCLLLYARMCRSYSLQVLTTVIAIGCLVRCLEKTERRFVGWSGLAILVTIYTHYVPGMALMGAANLTLLGRRRWRDAALLDGIVIVGLTPWVVWLVKSLESWGRHDQRYAAIGGVAEYALKLGYWGMSFLAGEAVPDPLLLLAMALAPLVLLVVWWGRSRLPGLFLLTAVLAGIGFIGVARWVSYPFLPARLLFVLPLMLLLFAAGAAVRPRLGTAACAALLTVFLAGDWCYFHTAGFRNKQYPMPVREIAALMKPGSLPLVDSANSDTAALEEALGPGRRVWQTTLPGTEPRLADPMLQTVWFLRNTHDISAGSLNARFETQLRRSVQLVSVRRYQPFTPLEHRLMLAIGMQHPPDYFSELLEFRRPYVR